MSREVAHRVVYSIEMLCLGLPVLILGGTIAGMGVMFGLGAFAKSIIGLFPLVWGLAGLCGLVGWLVLSFTFLAEGREGLKKRQRYWWVLLDIGAIAAIPPLVVMLLAGTWPVEWVPLFIGPLMLVPAAHLMWLGRGVRDSTLVVPDTR